LYSSALIFVNRGWWA